MTEREDPDRREREEEKRLREELHCEGKE